MPLPSLSPRRRIPIRIRIPIRPRSTRMMTPRRRAGPIRRARPGPTPTSPGRTMPCSIPHTQKRALARGTGVIPSGTPMPLGCEAALAVLPPIDDILQPLALARLRDLGPVEVLAGLGVVEDIGHGGGGDLALAAAGRGRARVQVRGGVDGRVGVRVRLRVVGCVVGDAEGRQAAAGGGGGGVRGRVVRCDGSRVVAALGREGRDVGGEGAVRWVVGGRGGGMGGPGGWEVGFARGLVLFELEEPVVPRREALVAFVEQAAVVAEGLDDPCQPTRPPSTQ